MPYIDHSDIRMPDPVDRVSERYFVSSAHGAESLTIKEVQIDPGWEGRMHVHNTDVSMQVTSGAIQAIIGDEVRTVRAGTTLLCPPGTPAQARQPPVDTGGAAHHLPDQRAPDQLPRIAVGPGQRI